MEPPHYSMIIEWSDEDDAFIVTVPELPGCITHGETYEAAVQRGKEVIEGWIEAAQADGQPIPEPETFTYWSPFHNGVEADAAQSSPAKG
jgi:predicted RNase H-like HicB family nuclease